MLNPHPVALAAALLFVASAATSTQSLAEPGNRREALKHYRTGQELLLGERFAHAADAFRSAIRFDALLTDAHYSLGHAYMALGRYPRAIEAFGDCIEAAKTLHSLHARDRVSADRAIDEELRELRDTMRRRSRQPLKVMQIEHRIQEVERSRSSLGTAFEVPASVLLALGSAHFRNGNPEAAEVHWSAAVRANSQLGEAWNNLAVIHLRTGRKTEAETAIQNAERAGFRVNPGLKNDVRAMK